MVATRIGDFFNPVTKGGSSILDYFVQGYSQLGSIAEKSLDDYINLDVSARTILFDHFFQLILPITGNYNYSAYHKKHHLQVDMRITDTIERLDELSAQIHDYCASNICGILSRFISFNCNFGHS